MEPCKHKEQQCTDLHFHSDGDSTSSGAMASIEHPGDAQAGQGIHMARGAKVGGLGITPSTDGAAHTRENHN